MRWQPNSTKLISPLRTNVLTKILRELYLENLFNTARNTGKNIFVKSHHSIEIPQILGVQEFSMIFHFSNNLGSKNSKSLELSHLSKKFGIQILAWWLPLSNSNENPYRNFTRPISTECTEYEKDTWYVFNVFFFILPSVLLTTWNEIKCQKIKHLEKSVKI